MTTLADKGSGGIAAFAFEAQSATGEAVTGTINAKLGQLQARVIALDLIRSPAPPRPGRSLPEAFEKHAANVPPLYSH